MLDIEHWTKILRGADDLVWFWKLIMKAGQWTIENETGR